MSKNEEKEQPRCYKVVALVVTGKGRNVFRTGDEVTEDKFPAGRAEAYVASGHLERIDGEATAAPGAKGSGLTGRAAELDELGVKELRPMMKELCEKKGLEYDSKMLKAPMVLFIVEAEKQPDKPAEAGAGEAGAGEAGSGEAGAGEAGAGEAGSGEAGAGEAGAAEAGATDPKATRLAELKEMPEAELIDLAQKLAQDNELEFDADMPDDQVYEFIIKAEFGSDDAE